MCDARLIVAFSTDGGSFPEFFGGPVEIALCQCKIAQLKQSFGEAILIIQFERKIIGALEQRLRVRVTAFVLKKDAAQLVQRLNHLHAGLALLAHGKALLEHFFRAFRVARDSGALAGESRASRLKRQQINPFCCGNFLTGRSQLSPVALAKPKFANCSRDSDRQVWRVFKRPVQCGTKIIVLSCDPLCPDRVFWPSAVCLGVLSEGGKIFGVCATRFLVGRRFLQVFETEFADRLEHTDPWLDLGRAAMPQQIVIDESTDGIDDFSLEIALLTTNFFGGGDRAPTGKHSKPAEDFLTIVIEEVIAP